MSEGLEGDDWTAHALGLAARGQLGRGPGGWLLDLPALAQPWGCASGLCAPGRRAPRARSCCADLELRPTDAERGAITAALPALAAALRDQDPRWSAGPPPIFAEGALSRPGRRCVFALEHPEGLRCALHLHEDAEGLPRGALKPLACRLFPLILVEGDDGSRLLSAVHRRTARLAGTRPAAAFPCLGQGATTLAEACQDTLRGLLGPRGAGAVVRAARAWAAG